MKSKIVSLVCTLSIFLSLFSMPVTVSAAGGDDEGIPSSAEYISQRDAVPDYPRLDSNLDALVAQQAEQMESFALENQIAMDAEKNVQVVIECQSGDTLAVQDAAQELGAVV